jgi:hypothetical protein
MGIEIFRVFGLRLFQARSEQKKLKSRSSAPTSVSKSPRVRATFGANGASNDAVVIENQA